MEYSTNYELKLPQDTDPVKVSDLSENFEKIDNLILGAYRSNLSVISGWLSGETFNISADSSNQRTFTLNLGRPVRCILAKASSYVTYNNATYASIGNAVTFSAPGIGGSVSASSGAFSSYVHVNLPEDSTTVTVTASFGTSITGGNSVGHFSGLSYVAFTDS